MAREFSRTQRVSEQIQRETAVLLQREIQDPRLAGATVSGVDVTRDLSHATIYVSAYSEASRGDIEAGLAQAGGFIRHHLAKKLSLRSMPVLHFVFDTTDIEGDRLSALIDAAVRKEQS